ncbi:lytic murein transglycosylase B [Thiohalocapsa marina]|uniref:Lytic murein transglycosylase B n=1 Tax=Thiohalocapsa marina TaxID=424902 RepID=A0A5M8FJ88_9GAMM|nr:lytic murein transglycosylase B [Thiohalocapsa marina]KAA6183241.1 lytic murein transglycosylase B [Thiohalocapsa marina]
MSAYRSRFVSAPKRAGLCVLPLAAALALSAGCASQPDRGPGVPDTARADAPLGRSTAPSSPRLTRGDFADRADVEHFIDRMQRQGFDRAELVAMFSQVRRDPWILEYMNRQWRPSPGPNGAWTRYRAKHISDDMLDRGLAFWQRHDATLERAGQKYGVPPEYIVAIIGIETKWGGYMGQHRIIDALSTLAFDYPRRADYFTDELEQFLIMARNEGKDPFASVGSFAGAMGLGQFMPSSYHKYAVDFDRDGRRDLWDPEDAIGSVAHYFARHGWRSGEPVAARAAGGAGLPQAMETGFNSRYSVGSLQSKGLRPAVALPAEQHVSLLRLDAAGGYEYWLGFENFYVITRYNHSTYYAMSVHQLAQALRARRGGSVPAAGPALRMTQAAPRQAPAG